VISTEDETNLVRFFGNSPFLRIVDALIDNIGGEYSKKEVQELAGISKGALFNHWHKLEELGIVKVTRAFGNTKLYTLDRKSAFVKDLLKLEARLIEESSPKKVSAVARYFFNNHIHQELHSFLNIKRLLFIIVLLS